jgi:TolB-like protein/Tfp pilus assembly protein PilF
VVEEGNLTQCVFALRKVLGDNASEHRFIVTVPGRGYQFAMEVRTPSVAGPPVVPPAAATPAPTRQLPPATAGPSLKTWAWSTCAALVLAAAGGWLFWPRDGESSVAKDQAPKPTTIAVLPFADLSPDGDMEYFADGLAEELIDKLAQAGNLRVIGKRSAFALKGRNDDAHAIGELLRVQVILEGSVRRTGDRIRITTQLTRTNDGITLWSRTYDRQLQDVLDIQGSIAREVVASMLPAASASFHSVAGALDAASTRIPEAYSAFLRGKHFYAIRTVAEYERARDEFSSATRLDPQFAMAHAWLARTYNTLAVTGVGDVANNRSLASASMERALKLEPRLADIWWINFNFFQGPNASLALRASALERSLVISPGDPDLMNKLADIYFQQGQRTEAFRMLEKSHEIDPLWAQTSFFLGLTSYMFRQNTRRALELAVELTQLSPNDPRGPILAGMIAMNEGRSQDWDRLMADAVAASPRDPTTHVYAATEYANLGAWDAARYHARIAQEVDPVSAAGWQSASHVLLLSGDMEGARQLVNATLQSSPNDQQSLIARAELDYFVGDCTSSLRLLLLAKPALDQPAASLIVMQNIEFLPMLVWCQRRVGNSSQAREIVDAINRVLAQPVVPGLLDAIPAQVAAANGDRPALIYHLTRLANSKGVQATFAPHEPMIQPFRADPEVSSLLARIEARRAKWRQVLNKTSMRVPIPAAPTSQGS